MALKPKESRIFNHKKVRYRSSSADNIVRTVPHSSIVVLKVRASWIYSRLWGRGAYIPDRVSPRGQVRWKCEIEIFQVSSGRYGIEQYYYSRLLHPLFPLHTYIYQVRTYRQEHNKGILLILLPGIVCKYSIREVDIIYVCVCCYLCLPRLPGMPNKWCVATAPVYFFCLDDNDPTTTVCRCCSIKYQGGGHWICWASMYLSTMKNQHTTTLPVGGVLSSS